MRRTRVSVRNLGRPLALLYVLLVPFLLCASHTVAQPYFRLYQSTLRSE